MSFAATNWAWEKVLPPAPKLILMALANIADDVGYCWPSVKKIAERCSVSVRTVQRTLRDFEAAGLLKVTRRFRPEDGRQTSNGYQLDLRSPPDKMPPSQVACHPAPDVGVTRGAPTLRQGEDVSAMAPLEPQQQPSSLSPQQPNDEDEGLVLPRSLAPFLSNAMRSLLAPCDPELRQAIADEVQGTAELGRLRSPLALAKDLRDKASIGAFAPNLGLEVAAKRASSRKRHLEERKRAQAKAMRLVEESDPERKARRHAAHVKAVEELKKRGL